MQGVGIWICSIIDNGCTESQLQHGIVPCEGIRPGVGEVFESLSTEAGNEVLGAQS